nr:hypothetical protein [Tanacetum cinerariifolium]
MSPQPVHTDNGVKTTQFYGQKIYGAGEMKNLKKTSQAPKGILVGLKMGFKLSKEYRHVPKKHTANSSSNKKKGVDSTNKVSDLNPFELLNLVDNDVEMGTNEGTSNLDNNGANSSGPSFECRKY